MHIDVQHALKDVYSHKIAPPPLPRDKTEGEIKKQNKKKRFLIINWEHEIS
jgi:hypothetical protein